jgi:hypothetical protein
MRGAGRDLPFVILTSPVILSEAKDLTPTTNVACERQIPRVRARDDKDGRARDDRLALP